MYIPGKKYRIHLACTVHKRLGPDAPDFTCTVPVVYMYTALWYTYSTCTVLENGIPLLAGFQIGGIA
eukprot:COSAG02_NODE_54725_length_294_cov_1.107692_1_plen_66_part_01